MRKPNDAPITQEELGEIETQVYTVLGRNPVQDEDTVREAVILARMIREDAEFANECYKETGDETWLHSRERMNSMLYFPNRIK